MKKVSEIMQELGFNKDAPEGTKEAFVRHLIKISTGVDTAAGPAERKEEQVRTAKKESQLSFNFPKDESA
jgi:hypothetical protein